MLRAQARAQGRAQEGGKLAAAAAPATVAAAAPTPSEPHVATPGSPQISCLVNGTPTTCLVDSDAVISLVRRGFLPGPPAPESALRLRGITGAVDKLRGPRALTFTLNGREYTWPRVYEANMTEECLIGSDIMAHFEMNILYSNKTLQVCRDPNGRPLQNRHVVRLDFTVAEPASVMPFTVFYVIRTPVQLDVPANSTAELVALLPAPPPLSETETRDAVLDQSRDWRTTAPTNHNCPTTAQPTRGNQVFHPAPHCHKRKWGENTPGPQCRNRTDESQRDLRVAPGPQCRNGTDESQRDLRVAPGPLCRTETDRPQQDQQAAASRPSETRHQRPRLGLLLPAADVPREVEIPLQIVPCLELEIRAQLHNTAPTRHVFRRRAIIAEVHLMSPFVLDTTPPETADTEASVRAADTATDTPPAKRPRRQLGADAPLPPDLQKLVDNCEDITGEERGQVEALLREYFDIFADGDEIGLCTWERFKIDTGDATPF